MHRLSAFIWMKKKKTLKKNNDQFGKSVIQVLKNKTNKQTEDKEKHQVKRNDPFILWESFQVIPSSQLTTQHSAPLTNELHRPWKSN